MTTRRGILVASTLAGLALYGYLHVLGLDARDAADELAVLRDLARGRIVSLHDSNRIASALIRLRASGHVVRREAAYYLTRAGWARAKDPLSEEELMWLSVEPAFGPLGNPEAGLIRRNLVRSVARRRGVLLYELTTPGRVALEGEV